jgi:hypothetical protein
MTENSSRSEVAFDLFGDPVPASWGRRGRPEHIATQQNRNKVTMLLAFGWGQERIARAMGIDPKTLRKNYSRELKFRLEQRDRLDASLAMRMWKEVEAGNIAAMKEFRKLVERNDQMLYGQGAPLPQVAKREVKLGKKEAAVVAAHNPDLSSTLGELMARRQGHSVN